jgi:hypothetical protein
MIQMFNRTYRFIIGAALLAAMPVVAQASTSRLEGMSLPGDYTKDYTAIYGWPSSIVGVGNLVYAELGNQNSNTSGTERAMGAVLPNLWDGKYGVWGLHLRETTPGLGQGGNTPDNSFFGGDPNSNNDEQFDLMWGKKFGNTNFGLRLNRSFEQEKIQAAGVTTLFEFDNNFDNGPFERNIMGIGGGIGFSMNDKTNGEVAVLYQSRTFENSVTPGNKFEDNGGSTYLVQGRMMWKWQPNVLVVPVVKFYNFDLGTKNTVGNTVTTLDNSLRGWSAGLAGNWALGSNDLFVLGATFAQNTLDVQNGNFSGFDPKITVKENASPEVFMALETQVNSWLTLRMGARKDVFYQVKYDGTDDEFHTGLTRTIKYSPFTMNIGAGVKVGSLTFDAVLDQLFYNNPIAQLTGGYESNYWDGSYVFQKVSATYTW